MSGTVKAKIGLAVFSMLLVAGMLEGVLRVLPQRPAPRGKGNLPWIAYHKTIGWENLAGYSGRQVKPGAFDVGIRINSLGLRGPDCPAEPLPDRPRILVIGDSFTFGHGVDTEDTFSARLQALLPETEVLNAGIVGVGHDQQLLWLRERGLGLKPDLIVWAYSSADIPRNTVYFRRLADPQTGLDFGKPRYVMKGDRLELIHVPTPLPEQVEAAIADFLRAHEALQPAVVRHSRLCRFVADRLQAMLERREQMRLAPALIREFAEVAREHAVPLLVINLPVEKWLATRNPLERIKQRMADGLWRRTMTELGSDALDLTGAFLQQPEINSLYIPHDGHYSVAGHDLIAQTLAPAVRVRIEKVSGGRRVLGRAP